MFTVIIGTSDGVRFYDENSIRHCGLAGHRVSAVLALSKSEWLAGTYESGIFRTLDGGKTWTPASNGLSAPCIRTFCIDPLDSQGILCGTEPARISRSIDRGAHWSEYDSIRHLERIDEWFLPYSPRAGAVRNIYHPPHDGYRLLASVEVGGILDSADHGASWTRSNITVDSDIHFVTGHPEDSDLLYAALGYAGLPGSPASEGEYQRGGVARSTDGGRTWEKLFTDYTRAVIVPSSSPDIVIACPGPYVGRQGRIEISRDKGATWQAAGGGIDIPMTDMVEQFAEAPDGTVWAICAQGRLLKTSVIGELNWANAVPELEGDAKSVAFIA